MTSILGKRRPVDDDVFDDIYPDAIRKMSPTHWTPTRVCARVVELLGLDSASRLLDIGSGPGKLCIVAAAMSGARVRGVERRPELVVVAREAARRFSVEATFAASSFEEDDPRDYDALYLFNPFKGSPPLPGDELDPFEGRALRDIAAAEDFLEEARVGTRLVTYCGFGGCVPPTYRLIEKQAWVGGTLALWDKASGEVEQTAG